MVFRAITRMILCAASILAFEAEVYAQQPQDNLVLERFPVARGGDVLMIPVRISGRNYQFLLDTGSTRTVCDKTLPLGQPRGEMEIETPEGKVKLRGYDIPNAMIGKLRFKSLEPVLAMDLTSFREVAGRGIDGLLGLDFLSATLCKSILHGAKFFS